MSTETSAELLDLMRATVADLRDEFVDDGRAASPEEINCGLCVDFAEALESRILGTPLARLPGAVLQFEDFAIDPDGDGEPGDIRIEAISREPGFEPPPGLTWEDLNRWRIGETVVHAWLSLGSLHYDAETPQGVANPLDLPCIRSTVVAVAEREDPDLVETLSGHGWWSDSRAIAERRRDALLGQVRAPGQG